MDLRQSVMGTTGEGGTATAYTLEAGPFRASFSDFGARWLSFEVPEGQGRSSDLLLGCADLAGYEASDAYFGATVGRYANRIGGASFVLDGIRYRLAANNGANHLHGGLRGFDRRLWKTTAYEESGCPALRFTLVSPDGEEGYPGRLDLSTSYVLSPDGRLDIRYEAGTDAPTILGLTQHAYFNLAGNGAGDILGHELRLAASRYLAVDEGLIPQGDPLPVAGGPFDFRSRKQVGRDIEAAGGYDHCFVIDRTAGEGKALVECAELMHMATGRSLKVSTTMPGIQLYTGNFLEGALGKEGRKYRRHSGLCLEAEYFPDTPNRPEFPSCVLRPGEEWRHTTRYSFSI